VFTCVGWEVTLFDPIYGKLTRPVALKGLFRRAISLTVTDRENFDISTHPYKHSLPNTSDGTTSFCSPVTPETTGPNDTQSNKTVRCRVGTNYLFPQS